MCLFFVDVTATLGCTVNLACDVGGSIFGWHKRNSGEGWSLLFSEKYKGKYEGYERTNLTIKNVDTNDAGVYRCFSFGNNTGSSLQYGSNISVKLPGT